MNEMNENNEIDKLLPLKIGKILFNGRRFGIVRDDILPGGTKQRCILRLIGDVLKNQPDVQKIVYAGPATGFAIIAMAIAADYFNITADIHLIGGFPRSGDTNQMIRAKNIAKNNIKFFDAETAKIEDASKLIAKKYDNDKKTFIIPFGFDSEKIKKLLIESISAAWDKEAESGNLNTTFYGDRKRYSGRIFVVGGSTTLLNSLYLVFPAARFLVVQVGKKIWPDQIDSSRTIIKIAPERFFEPAAIKAPYPSVDTYDEKVWRFVLSCGEDDDLIWNVGSNRRPEAAAFYNEVSLSREIDRLIFIDSLIEKSAALPTNIHQAAVYEILNCFERYFLSQSNFTICGYNDFGYKNDRIFGIKINEFSIDKLAAEIENVSKKWPGITFKKAIFRQMIEEKYYKNIDYKNISSSPMEQIVARQSSLYEIDNEKGRKDIVIRFITPNYKQKNSYLFERKISFQRYKILSDYCENRRRNSSKSDEIDNENDNKIDKLMPLAAVCARLNCILARGQHWNAPQEIYEYFIKNKGVTLEGFSSPMNSQILSILSSAGNGMSEVMINKLNFCSLFEDTDEFFGSLGGFFNVNLVGRNSYVGPPYVIDILDKMTEKILKSMSAAAKSMKETIIYLTVVHWADAEFNSLLLKSEYMIHSYIFAKETHAYYDSNNNDRQVFAKFETILMVFVSGFDTKKSEKIKEEHMKFGPELHEIWRAADKKRSK
jgi:hypothetical protein